MLPISFLNFSFCLCIAFLISTGCLCPLVAHWFSLIWLFRIIFQEIPRFPFLWGPPLELYFLDSSCCLNSSIVIFAFEEVVPTVNLYWLPLRVKNLHQSPQLKMGGAVSQAFFMDALTPIFLFPLREHLGFCVFSWSHKVSLGTEGLLLIFSRMVPWNIQDYMPSLILT